MIIISSLNLQNSTTVERKFSLRAPEQPWSLWFPRSARALRRRPAAWRGLARLGARRSTSGRRCARTHRPGRRMGRNPLGQRTSKRWTLMKCDGYWRVEWTTGMELKQRILLCSFLLKLLNGSVHHGKWWCSNQQQLLFFFLSTLDYWGVVGSSRFQTNPTIILSIPWDPHV